MKCPYVDPCFNKLPGNECGRGNGACLKAGVEPKANERELEPDKEAK